MPTDKALSPEVDAARHAAAAEKQRVRDQAQAKLAAQNKQMKKRLAATGDSKEEAARKAIVEEKQRVKDQAQAELDAGNTEMEKRVSASGAADSARLPPVDAPDAPLPAAAAATQEAPASTTKVMPLSDAFADSTSGEVGGGASVAPAAATYLACATFVPSTTTMLSLDHKLKAEAAHGQANEAEAAARVSTPTAEPLRKATFVPSTTTVVSLDEKFKAGHAAPRTAEAEAVAQNIRKAEPLRAVLPPPGPPLPRPPPPRAAPSLTPRRASFLGGLSASGLKYSSERGMWLPTSLVATSELSADAAAAALSAPGALPPDALPPGALGVAAKPRGKPPSFGGLGSSGLKFDPASGFWLPPGKEGTVRAPRPGRPPLLGRLGASGLRYSPL